MKSILPEDKKWEEAFVRFGFDAAVGRLFKGIIHNLNGVGQAFMMQTELLNMMFKKVDATLNEVSQLQNIGEIHEKLGKMREMMQGRADLAKHLTGEVSVLQKIMQRTSMVVDEVDGETSTAYDISSVIDIEMEFLKSDGFFKHKIRKNLDLSDDLPKLFDHRIELQQIISIILVNASHALSVDGAEAPEISITGRADHEMIIIEICDNGPGIGGDDLERIFEPFFSTRVGGLGVGLYLARTMAENFGGSLSCESSAGRTCFTLRKPLSAGGGFEK